MPVVVLMFAAAVTTPAEAGLRYGAPQRLAQARPPGNSGRQEQSDEVSISPGQAADIAAARTGGRVLDVRLQGGKRPRYRVRVLLGGERVRTVTVDALTGEFRG